MTEPTLIASPYHLGRRNEGLGSGVPVLAAALGEGREVLWVELPGTHSNEIAGSFAVVHAIAQQVECADFPVVLAGNCSSSLGTVTGIGGGVGVIWFDAHGDFHTPETTPTGFFDGMPLAMLTGSGWDALRTGLASVPATHVVHVGGRDFDEGERERLERAGARIVRRTPIDDDALDDLRREVDSVYVHVDLDALDPSVGRANELTVDDGLSLEDVTDAIDAIQERFVVRAAALTAYEPAYDPEGTIPGAARAIFERLVAKVNA